jgi:hypothetical protein
VSTTHPTTPELVEALVLFIENTVAPQLKDRDAFLARVAVNALNTVARELEQGAGLKAQATRRLRPLLEQPDGTYDALNTELCTAIREGRMTAATPGLLEHLQAETIDRVRIDQPNYAGLKAALARAAGSAEPA